MDVELQEREHKVKERMDDVDKRLNIMKSEKEVTEQQISTLK